MNFIRIQCHARAFLSQVSSSGSRRDKRLNIRGGDIVEVRNREEILETLDSDGSLEGLPFLPEMSLFCGRRFRVLREVNKILVEGETEMRRIRGTVILAGVICDGEAHGGCQRYCPILWKKAWLKRVR